MNAQTELRYLFTQRLPDSAPKVVEMWRASVAPHIKRCLESDREDGRIDQQANAAMSTWLAENGFGRPDWDWLPIAGFDVRWLPSEYFGLVDHLVERLPDTELRIPIAKWNPETHPRTDWRARIMSVVEREVDRYLDDTERRARESGVEPMMRKKGVRETQVEAMDWLIEKRCHKRSWTQLEQKFERPISTIRTAVANLETALCSSAE